ncbi:hypothetical protein CPB83DRAFT_847566 [Crepidotus variabilis]|uniref:Uncharacterized protein n=1 Tax=Crepidotus variabilis TaxID=179855 RepID=A0A9P6ENP4_9AGAR|nr:hypothetical protein CPB83DRAFT_847566 [Crepidotus variabilis]
MVTDRPVFHFPLWVEGTLVLVVLLCQVGMPTVSLAHSILNVIIAGTMALCLRFNPDVDCRRAQNQSKSTGLRRLDTED